MDTTVITKYRVKKYLKIFTLVLFLSLIGLVIYGYVRILPKDIKYSNVSSSSFTVSWTTKTPTKGAVRVIESNNNLPISFNIFEKEIFNDTRDVRMSELISAQETEENIWESNSFVVKVSDFVTERVVTERGTYYTHHIEVKGLDQEHEYSVMVGDGLLFLNSKNFSHAKSVMTTTIPEAMDTPLPAYGQIKDAQNQDIPIDELKPVTDGVVYFNYLDESTQERSNVFSSSLNESGGWYIDIATAVDKDGEYFFEKYSQTITNIYGELLIDLGPLGTWKKVIDMNESSPVETIVINMSNSFEDEGSVKRIDSSNGLVKGVEASACNFAGWCGPCFDGNKDNSCSCPEATLKARKCDGETTLTMQEVQKQFEKCANGGNVGDYVYYGGECKICTEDKLWSSKGVDRNLCDGNQGGAIFSPPEEKQEKELADTHEDVKVDIRPICTTCHDTVETLNNYDGLPGCTVCHNPEITTEVPPVPSEIFGFTLLRKIIPVLPNEICQKESEGEICLCLGPTTELKDGELCKKKLSPAVIPVPTVIPTVTPTPSPGSLIPNFFKSSSKVFATETLSLDYEEYVIDPINSTVSIQFPGEYIFEKDGEMYFLGLTQEEINKNSGQLKIYVDTDGNGKYEEDKDSKISDFGSIVKVSTLSQTYIYDLEPGYNFITFPFLSIAAEQRTAAGMLSLLNHTFKDSIYSISKYDGRWQIVGQNEQLYGNEDFQLVPGHGYIIKSKSKQTISILGKPIQFKEQGDNAPITFYPGWNLIGVYGSEVKQYTAKSLIQSINKYEPVDFTANNVSRWESDVQRYDGFQLSNENGIDIEYGFDFPINTLQSYFVRILQGKGNWQPELK